MKNFGLVKFTKNGLSVQIYKRVDNNFGCAVTTPSGRSYLKCFDNKITVVELEQEIDKWTEELNVYKTVVFNWISKNLSITRLGDSYYVNHLGESMPCDDVEDALKYIERLVND